MKNLNFYAFLMFILFMLAGFVGIAAATEGQGVEIGQQSDYQAVVSQIKKHDKRLSREMRQVKRELAVLQQSIEKPDAKDIISGIGYILGLFGVAAYMASRKDNK